MLGFNRIISGIVGQVFYFPGIIQQIKKLLISFALRIYIVFVLMGSYHPAFAAAVGFIISKLYDQVVPPIGNGIFNDRTQAFASKLYMGFNAGIVAKGR